MKKNKLTTAVLAGITGVAGIAGISNAVHVNSEGLGQVLVYPYYTVNNDLNTLLSVVNTTEFTKAVKVRFLEGDNSLEVLDFNLYLSPFDVWTAGLIPFTSTASSVLGDHTGEPSGAIVFNDNSCTPFLTSGQQFLPFTIDVDLDPTNMNMERSRDGHFEIIEMGNLDPTFGFGADAVHGMDGVPADCQQLQDNWIGAMGAGTGAWDADTGGDPTLELLPVSGGIFGSASIVNVAEGTDVAYNAEALQDFWAAGQISHTEPGDLLPSLGSGVSDSIVYLNGSAVASSWATGIEAVSAVFMRDELYNEYALDADINAKTEWVVTFPTKRFHVDVSPAVVAIPPFFDVWDGVEACETYTFFVWDREEGDVPFCELEPNSPFCAGGTVSPVAPGPGGGSLPVFCQEANVLEFLNGTDPTPASGIMGSTNLAQAQTFENGWGRISFSGATQTSTPLVGAGYNGLPVTGFSVQQYTNSNAAPGVLAQYAGLFKHKGRIVSN